MHIEDNKIVGQFIDTLKTSHFCLNPKHFHKYYQPLCEELKEKKENAQKNATYGNRYIVDTNFLGFGKFKIFAQGTQNYAYRVENEDITLLFSNPKEFPSKNPQLKVEFRSSYLFREGHKRAYEFVLKVVKKIVGKSRNLCSEIHLATDVCGVKYNSLDISRFQTLYSKTNFREYYKVHKLTGMHFGRGDFLLRIYDKVGEISKNKNKSFFKSFWILNGYKEGDSVWRHEVQYRRAELKSFINPVSFNRMQDETLYFFERLPMLWKNATEKVRFTELSDNEVVRVVNSDNASSIRSIFHRARKKGADSFWNSITTWNNIDLRDSSVVRFKHFSTPNLEYAKRSIKSFVGQVYKVCGGDSRYLLDTFIELDRDLEKEGLNIHTYGLNRVFQDFSKAYVSSVYNLKNEQISDNLVVPSLPTHDFNIFKDSYRELLTHIKDIDEKKSLEDKYNTVKGLNMVDMIEYTESQYQLQHDSDIIVNDDRDIDIPDIF